MPRFEVDMRGPGAVVQVDTKENSSTPTQKIGHKFSTRAAERYDLTYPDLSRLSHHCSWSDYQKLVAELEEYREKLLAWDAHSDWVKE